jgi:folate-dependent phosphoribosylglycinamide formyltransferase PurN
LPELAAANKKLNETEGGSNSAQIDISLQKDDDSADGLAARILKEEHRIYPEAVKLIAAGRVKIEGRKVKILKEEK